MFLGTKPRTGFYSIDTEGDDAPPSDGENAPLSDDDLQQQSNDGEGPLELSDNDQDAQRPYAKEKPVVVRKRKNTEPKRPPAAKKPKLTVEL